VGSWGWGEGRGGKETKESRGSEEKERVSAQRGGTALPRVPKPLERKGGGGGGPGRDCPFGKANFAEKDVVPCHRDAGVRYAGGEGSRTG